MGTNRLQSVIVALLVVCACVGCPDNGVDLPPDLPPYTVTVHNDRPWDLSLDSGAWTLDVSANGSASVAVWPGMWAILCIWADGVGQTQIWGVDDSDIEWTVSDDCPPVWSYVP